MSPRAKNKPHVKAVSLEDWEAMSLTDDMRADGYTSVQDWLEDAVLLKLAPKNAQARALLRNKQEQRKLRREAGK